MNYEWVVFFFVGGEDVGEDGERQRTFEKHNPEQQQQQQQPQPQPQPQPKKKHKQKTAKLAATKSRVICYILDTVCIVDEILPNLYRDYSKPQGSQWIIGRLSGFWMFSGRIEVPLLEMMSWIENAEKFKKKIFLVK